MVEVLEVDCLLEVAEREVRQAEVAGNQVVVGSLLLAEK